MKENMTVHDLNRDQLTELKQAMYSEDNESVSYGELAAIDELVSDEAVKERYEGYVFTADDFFCSASVPEKVTAA